MRVSLVLAVVLVAGAFAAPSANIDPALRRTLKTQGTANIIIAFKQGTAQTLAALKNAKFATRAEKVNGVAAALKQNAQQTQSQVISFLNRNSTPKVKSFWINNKIFVPNASAKLIETLASFPEISSITEEIIVQIEPMLNTQDFPVHHKQPKDVEWGVEIIEAEAVWNMDGGNSGEGIVVANIDTGVRYTHEALSHNWREDHGWLDPYNSQQRPVDNNGHGTHTMGTLVGANGIGVAPGATWIACQGCAWFGCTEAALLTCGQFGLCPTDPNGDNEDCTLAPNLVSNSWGGGQGDDFYEGVVSAWRAADIVPLFAIGNSGPSCGTANSPGDSPNIIGIGSTTENDSLSDFSSRGPSVNGLIKPDVSAPGSNIYSAYADSDTSYRNASGTSMACPHAAGVVALLLARDPTLSVDEVTSYLIYGNAQAELIKPGQNCGGIDEDTFPNNAFGQGRINAFNSVLHLIENPPPKP